MEVILAKYFPTGAGVAAAPCSSGAQSTANHVSSSTCRNRSVGFLRATEAAVTPTSLGLGTRYVVHLPHPMVDNKTSRSVKMQSREGCWSHSGIALHHTAAPTCRLPRGLRPLPRGVASVASPSSPILPFGLPRLEACVCLSSLPPPPCFPGCRLCVCVSSHHLCSLPGYPCFLGRRSYLNSRHLIRVLGCGVLCLRLF